MRRDVRATPKEREKIQVREDALIKALKSRTPEQAAQWVESNVNSFADAKDFLKTVARLVTFIAKRDL